MNRAQLLHCLTAVLATASVNPSKICKGPVFKIDGVNYIRELIKKDISDPVIYGYDRSTNSIILSYNMFEPFYTPKYVKLNLDTKESVDLKFGVQVLTMKVDVKTNNIYMSDYDDNIYKYDEINDKTELYITKEAIGFKDDDDYISILYVKDDVVYVSTVDGRTIYRIENGVSSEFKDIASPQTTTLLIGDDNVNFFSNLTGVYRQKDGIKEAIHSKDDSILWIENLAFNNKGDLYVASINPSGIYVLRNNTDKFELFLKLRSTIVFDNDYNMVYTNCTSVYRLTPTNNPYCD